MKFPQHINYKLLFTIVFIILILLIGTYLINYRSFHASDKDYSPLMDEYIISKNEKNQEIKYNDGRLALLKTQDATIEGELKKFGQLKYDSLVINSSKKYTDKVLVLQDFVSSQLGYDYGEIRFFNNYDYGYDADYDYGYNFDNDLNLLSTYRKHITSIYSPDREAFEQFKKNISQDFQAQKENIGVQIKKLESINGQTKEDIEKIDKKITTISKISSNNLLIRFAIPIFALTLIFLLVVPAIYTRSKIQELIFGKGMLTELITVFLLIATILILGIGGLVNEQVLGTLLGGISVYVLQKGKSSFSNEQTKEEPKSENVQTISVDKDKKENLNT